MYQKNFSVIHQNNFEYIASREIKGQKILSILQDYGAEDLSTLTVLEAGCFTGRISHFLAPYFGRYYGIDIDANAIARAKETKRSANLSFLCESADRLSFANDTFDILLCAHLYEHVPEPQVLMQEIYRVLKPGGFCYFSAGNRIVAIDPEYGLPFATMLPKRLADAYVRWQRGLPEYYETFMTLPSLRKLVRNFRVIDYTRKIIESPDKYHADDMIRNGTIKQKALLWILKWFYWLSPTYIWILAKRS